QDKNKAKKAVLQIESMITAPTTAMWHSDNDSKLHIIAVGAVFVISNVFIVSSYWVASWNSHSSGYDVGGVIGLAIVVFWMCCSYYYAIVLLG
ncbi:7847_t:CDS:2, partial [Gigaspora rosea]